MLLSNVELVDHAQAVAVTYCETLILTRAAFEQVAETFAPDSLPIIKVRAQSHAVHARHLCTPPSAHGDARALCASGRCARPCVACSSRARCSGT